MLKPGQFDILKLAPLYQKVYEKLKAASADNIMWFEPAQYPDTDGYNNSTIVPEGKVGFTSPPGGDYGSPNHLLNDHAYCCQLSKEICAKGEPQPEDSDRCLDYHTRRIGNRAQDAMVMGIPFMISEFGACLGEVSCSTEIGQVADRADKELATGWAYWQLKTYKDLTTTAGASSEGFYDPDGTLQAWKVKALSRTYVQYGQGNITRVRFSTEPGHEGEFFAEIQVNTTVQTPTVIFASGAVPKETSWYPNDLVVTYATTDGSAAPEVRVIRADPNEILVSVDDVAFNGKTIRICVAPVASNFDCANPEAKAKM